MRHDLELFSVLVTPPVSKPGVLDYTRDTADSSQSVLSLSVIPGNRRKRKEWDNLDKAKPRMIQNLWMFRKWLLGFC